MFWFGKSPLTEIKPLLAESYFREARGPALLQLEDEAYAREATRLGERAQAEWDALTGALQAAEKLDDTARAELDALAGSLYDVYMVGQDAKVYRDAGTGSEAIWQELRADHAAKAERARQQLLAFLAAHP